MTVIVNGEPIDVAPGVGLEAVVEIVTVAAKGVAVAVNGDIVPRSVWGQTTLSDGDRVEVLAAAQGG